MYLKSFLKFIYIPFFIVLFFSFTFASLSISPLRFEFDINPWETITEIIRVTNRWDTAITLYTSREDFTAWDETWTPRFIDRSDLDNPEFALSTWISTNQDNLTLWPWETREVPFTISVPEIAEPWWHYWALFFSPWSSWWQVAVVSRLWVLMLVNVPWEVNIAGDLLSFDVWNKYNNLFNVSKNFNDFPIYFRTRFENEWNVHIRPVWKIEILDEDWNPLKNIWKEILSSPAWAFMWEKLVDYIPINDAAGNVLPNSIRSFESSWQWFWYNVLDQDWRRVVNFRNLQEHYEHEASQNTQYLKFWETIRSVPVTRDFTLQMQLSFVWKDWIVNEFFEQDKISVSYIETRVVINNYIIVISIILLIWLLYYFIVYRKKSEERLRKKILEEMNNMKDLSK